jgi:RimJ/RimL family protein N-acetyltransferase
MQHGHVIEGPAFRLRPVAAADADLIVTLRNDPALARWLHAGAADVAAQRRWLADYEQRPGDFYFVIESRASGKAEGLIAVYDVDCSARSAEWGRWVLRPGSLAAVESAWLIYRFAFEVLGLQSLHCRTVADNEAVVSFHDSCGLTDKRVLPQAVELLGAQHDLVEHRLRAVDWIDVAPNLERLAALTARRLQRANL